jgi:anti-sigma B factor antagonist
MLTIQELKFETTTVLALSGRLDGQTGPSLDAVIPESGSVVLDLSDLSYVSSAGLRSILQALKKTKSSGGSLSLCSIQQAVMKLLELSGFLSLVSTYPDREGALNA